MLSQIICDESKSLKDALKIIDINGKGICFITKNNYFLIGILTDGDIRRSLLKGFSFHDKVTKIINRKPLTLSSNVSKEQFFALLTIC